MQISSHVNPNGSRGDSLSPPLISFGRCPKTLIGVGEYYQFTFQVLPANFLTAAVSLPEIVLNFFLEIVEVYIPVNK